MFIRSRKVNGIKYHYVVKNTRIDGRVIQQNVAYLGLYPSINAAIEGYGKELQHLESKSELLGLSMIEHGFNRTQQKKYDSLTKRIQFLTDKIKEIQSLS